MRTALSLRPSEPCAEGTRSPTASAGCAVPSCELCAETQTVPVSEPLVEFSASPLEFSASPCKGEAASRADGLQAGDATATGGCAGLLCCCGTACCGAALTVCGADPARIRQGAVMKRQSFPRCRVTVQCQSKS